MTASTRLRFDERFYPQMNEARWERSAGCWPPSGKRRRSRRSWIGSGPGWFSGRLVQPPRHVDFSDGPPQRQRREMFLATDLELADEALKPMVAAKLRKFDYAKPVGGRA